MVAHGANTGVRNFFTTTEDGVRGTNLKDATNYYFAVSAYAANPSAPANRVLESPLSVVEVVPQRSSSSVNASMVRAVPNPYFAHSTYELSQFQRKIKFVNCPAQCTIRLYNLNGQLVRTLEKNDPSTSIVEWDIKTKNGLPVGSGVYVYHVHAGDGSESIGRVVVFMEKERLNTF